MASQPASGLEGPQAPYKGNDCFRDGYPVSSCSNGGLRTSVPEKERQGVPAPSPLRLVGGNFRTRTPSSLITTPSPRSKLATAIKCNRSSSAYDFLKASQPAQFQLHRPNSGPDSLPLRKTTDSRRSRRGGLVGAEGNYREKRTNNTVTRIPFLNYDSPFMKASPRVVVGKECIPVRWSLTLNSPFLSPPFLSK
jgi:hypothetical protein